jgi:hypothetical protein
MVELEKLDGGTPIERGTFVGIVEGGTSPQDPLKNEPDGLKNEPDGLENEAPPHVLTSQEKAVIEKKKFFEKKKINFPRTGTFTKKTKILPAHRAIFQNYKDQGFRHLGKAIRKTGVYSEGIAERVGQITKTKSWQLIMQEYMPEEHLALRHSELLDKREYRTIKNDDGTTTELDSGPETAAVTKGLELAYRLRGSFQKEDTPPPSTVMYNLFYKPEVREQMRVFEDGLKTTLLNEINKRNLADIETEEENKGNLASGGGTSGPEDEPEGDRGDGEQTHG